MGEKICRISTIKPFIDNLNWENITFSSQDKDYQVLEMNNKSIALNILQFNNEQKISHLY